MSPEGLSKTGAYPKVEHLIGARVGSLKIQGQNTQTV
jgi:hypothetical protein